MVNVRDDFSHLLSIWWLRMLIYFTGIAVVIGLYIVLEANMLFFQQVVALSVVGLAFGIEYIRNDGNYSTLGFSISRFTIREVLLGIMLGVGALGVISSAALLCGATINAEEILYESIYGTLLTALTEEIIFRGMMVRAIEQRFGGMMGIFVSSMVFAGAHLFNTTCTSVAFINIALAGMVFGAMYLLTRSLWMSISFHAAWNFIEYSVFGRSPDPMIFAGVPEQSRWLFTGEYGIEQGLCTTIVLVLILIVLPKITTVSPYAAAALFKQQYAEAHLNAS